MSVYGEINPDDGVRFDTFTTRDEAAEHAHQLQQGDSWSTDPEICLEEDMFTSAYMVAQIGSVAFRKVLGHAFKELERMREEEELNDS
jgi:hypothetical protein